MASISVQVSRKGAVKIVTQGIKGEGCIALTEFLSKGEKSEFTRSSEYYDKPSQTDQQVRT
jgi:hypothetical protein